MRMIKITALLTAILAIAFALAPAVTSPFTGFTADQLPIPQIDPPVQPAGYAFAIWGVIYLWLVISALWGLWKRSDDETWHRARIPLIISLAIGIPWLAIANASAIWATITIWLMWVFAAIALLRAPITDRWLFQTPVALYTGWLTAASCVSLATTLAGYGILMGSFGWAIAGIAIALTLALAIHGNRTNAPEYLAAVVWALIGIIVANAGSSLPVTALAALGAVYLSYKAFRSVSPAM